MAIIYLGLGSNLGDREMYLRQALDELRKIGVAIERVSTFIETDPAGGPPQGKFLNAALKAVTDLQPFELLKQIQQIEIKLGRIRSVRHGPRTIDIDILLYDHLHLDNPALILPHPRMPEREFVMRPLREIDPDIAREITYANH